jgi:chaperone required for assembly of F1-ATPase
VVLQEKHWDPLLNWARSTFDVEIHKFNSILFNSQPEATKQKLGKILGQFDPWEMAGTVSPHFCFIGIDVVGAKLWSVRHTRQNRLLWPWLLLRDT